VRLTIPAPLLPLRPTLGRGTALALGAAAAAAVVAALTPNVPQDPGYHPFADARTLLGVANALDVLSNLAFALAGAFGTWVVLREPQALRDPAERTAWLVVFLGVAATAAGSAYYHLAPDGERLFWDRLPMAIGFAGLAAALVAERVGVAAARRWLWPMVLVSGWSVVYWRWSERAGVGDLRAYALVQVASLLAIPILVARFRGPAGASRSWMTALALYALAKVAESLDGPIYAATGTLSGHTLKHLLAALGVAWLARMLHARARASTSALGPP